MDGDLKDSRYSLFLNLNDLYHDPTSFVIQQIKQKLNQQKNCKIQNLTKNGKKNFNLCEDKFLL